MNVSFAVFVTTLLAVLVFCISVVIFYQLSWTEDTAVGYEDGRSSQKFVSTELQSRMKLFLMRNSAADIPLDNDFVIVSRSSSTQSHGSMHCNLFTFWSWDYNSD